MTTLGWAAPHHGGSIGCHRVVSAAPTTRIGPSGGVYVAGSPPAMRQQGTVLAAATSAPRSRVGSFGGATVVGMAANHHGAGAAVGVHRLMSRGGQAAATVTPAAPGSLHGSGPHGFVGISPLFGRAPSKNDHQQVTTTHNTLSSSGGRQMARPHGAGVQPLTKHFNSSSRHASPFTRSTVPVSVEAGGTLGAVSVGRRTAGHTVHHMAVAGQPTAASPFTTGTGSNTQTSPSAAIVTPSPIVAAVIQNKQLLSHAAPVARGVQLQQFVQQQPAATPHNNQGGQTWQATTTMTTTTPSPAPATMTPLGLTGTAGGTRLTSAGAAGSGGTVGSFLPVGSQERLNGQTLVRRQFTAADAAWPTAARYSPTSGAELHHPQQQTNIAARRVLSRETIGTTAATPSNPDFLPQVLERRVISQKVYEVDACGNRVERTIPPATTGVPLITRTSAGSSNSGQQAYGTAPTTLYAGQNVANGRTTPFQRREIRLPLANGANTVGGGVTTLYRPGTFGQLPLLQNYPSHDRMISSPAACLTPAGNSRREPSSESSSSEAVDLTLAKGDNNAATAGLLFKSGKGFGDKSLRSPSNNSARRITMDHQPASLWMSAAEGSYAGDDFKSMLLSLESRLDASPLLPPAEPYNHYQHHYRTAHERKSSGGPQQISLTGNASFELTALNSPTPSSRGDPDDDRPMFPKKKPQPQPLHTVVQRRVITPDHNVGLLLGGGATRQFHNNGQQPRSTTNILTTAAAPAALPLGGGVVHRPFVQTTTTYRVDGQALPATVQYRGGVDRPRAVLA